MIDIIRIPGKKEFVLPEEWKPLLRKRVMWEVELIIWNINKAEWRVK
jgi:hypothetical protein